MINKHLDLVENQRKTYWMLEELLFLQEANKKGNVLWLLGLSCYGVDLSSYKANECIDLHSKGILKKYDQYLQIQFLLFVLALSVNSLVSIDMR